MSARTDLHRDFFAELQARGLLAYGASFSTDLVHELLGLEVPEVGTKSEFDRVALAELSAIGYVRDQLLKTGRYIAGTTGGYRVLLPSENARQVEQYITSATSKLRRATLLNKTTPIEHRNINDSLDARLMLMKSGSVSRFKLGDADSMVQ